MHKEAYWVSSHDTYYSLNYHTPADSVLKRHIFVVIHMKQFTHGLHKKMAFKHSHSLFAQHVIVPHGLSKLLLSRTSFSQWFHFLLEMNFEPVLLSNRISSRTRGKSTCSAVITTNDIFHLQSAPKPFVDNVDSLHTGINVTPVLHSQVPPFICPIRPLLRTEEAWTQCDWISSFFSCTC